MNRYDFIQKKDLPYWYEYKKKLVIHFPNHTCRIKMQEWGGWYYWDIITGRGGRRERIVKKGRASSFDEAKEVVVSKLQKID